MWIVAQANAAAGPRRALSADCQRVQENERAAQVAGSGSAHNRLNAATSWAAQGQSCWIRNRILRPDRLTLAGVCNSL